MFDSIATYFGNIFTALVLIFTDSCTALPTIKVNSAETTQNAPLILTNFVSHGNIIPRIPYTFCLYFITVRVTFIYIYAFQNRLALIFLRKKTLL